MFDTDPFRPRLAALIYGDRGSGDPVLAALARALAAEGRRLAGMVQVNEIRADRCRCDMVLEDLTSGRRLPISQDLGRIDRGCRLDTGQLESAAALVLAGLSTRTDLLILSKFGKREAEGGGFRQVIEAAVSLDVPVILGVSRTHRAAWDAFAGDLAETLVTAVQARAWVRAALGSRQVRAA